MKLETHTNRNAPWAITIEPETIQELMQIRDNVERAIKSHTRDIYSSRIHGASIYINGIIEVKNSID